MAKDGEFGNILGPSSYKSLDKRAHLKRPGRTEPLGALTPVGEEEKDTIS